MEPPAATPGLSEATVSLLKVAYPYLIATGLVVARTLGVVMISPVFTRLGITGMIRSCIAVAVALPMVPPVVEQISLLSGLSTFSVVGLMVKEVAVGALIGFVFGIPFWAGEAAGDMIDLQRGTTSAQLLDPTSMTESGISATLLSITMIALFFTSGGFNLMADMLYRSYQLWPAAQFQPVATEGAGLALLKALDRVMQLALLLVAPIMVALLAADLMLGYLSRLAPQIHVFDLSLAVKNLLFAFLMVIYAIYLAPAMMTEIGALHATFDMLRALAPKP
jgi:type III secretion protein T